MAVVVSAPSVSGRIFLRTLIGAGIVSFVGLFAVRAMASSQLRPELRTNKGCLETGDTATFAIGESMIIFFSVGSPSFSAADVTLFVFKPGVLVNAIGFGSLMTNAPFAIRSRVGTPTGRHQLLLQAGAGAVISARSCSFKVVGVVTTPQPSPTPTPTMTPPNTRTPTSTAPTRTPAMALRPHITTDRGCAETGQQSTFHLGEPITVSFEIDSDVVAFTRATLFDVLSDGFVNVFPLGVVATNRTFRLSATIAPPLGAEALKLDARNFGLPSASSTCTFSVMP